MYCGDKLPPKYIGSSTIKKLENGYRGSVSSKKYKTIFNSELNTNPSLFNYEILYSFETRKEALIMERELHLEFDVVKSNEFFNMSIAQPNGYFGMDVSGENNPGYGRYKSDGEKKKISEALKGHKRTLESISKQIRNMSGDNHWNYGNHLTKTTKEKISSQLKGRISHMKGKSYNDVYSDEKILSIKSKISEANSGTYEEKYGIEKAKILKDTLSEKNSGIGNPNYNNGYKISGTKHFFYGKKRPDISELMRNRVISDETRLKISEFHAKSYDEKYGKDRSLEIRDKLSEAQTGEKNGNAKKFRFTSPKNIETIVVGGFQQFCKENNIGTDAMYSSIKSNNVCNRGKSKGWKCEVI